MKHHVFVYGTLKSGHYNNRAMVLGGQSKLVSEDSEIAGQMYDLGPYPAVTLGGTKPVKGEVWLVDDETLKRLDHLEGHPDFYQRVKVPLLYSSDFEVWIYVMPKSMIPKSAVPIPEGIWYKTHQ